MSFREEIQRKLNRQKKDISDLEQRIQGLSASLETARSYAQGIEDALKLIPKDEEGGRSHVTAAFVLRRGTSVWQAQQVILEQGKPMHIGALLKAIGKEDNPSNRVSLAGSLGAYVRDGKIFSRPAPNVFGLLELEVGSADLQEKEIEEAA